MSMNGGQQHRASWLQSWHQNWHLGAPDMSSVSDGINWLWRKRDRRGEVAQASKLTLQDWRQSSGRRGLQHDKCWWDGYQEEGEGTEVFWPAGVDLGNIWCNAVLTAFTQPEKSNSLWGCTISIFYYKKKLPLIVSAWQWICANTLKKHKLSLFWQKPVTI